MTAQLSQSDQILLRIIALEEKLNTEFGLFRSRFEEYRLLSENRHLHTSVVNTEQGVTEMEQELETSQKKQVEEYRYLHALVARKDQRITELEQQLEACQKKIKDLEKKCMDLEKRPEEVDVQMLTGNIGSSSNIEVSM